MSIISYWQYWATIIHISHILYRKIQCDVCDICWYRTIKSLVSFGDSLSHLPTTSKRGEEGRKEETEGPMFYNNANPCCPD